jgi:hypothetical protein
MTEAFEQVHLAERVIDLAEAGYVREALHLLAAEGDPAAKADAHAALACDRKRSTAFRRGIIAALSASALIAPTVADAAPEVGTVTNFGSPVTHVAKPASKALIAKAEKFVLADVNRYETGHGITGVTYTVSCKGTMKLIACKTATIQGAGTAQEYTETLHVSHGQFVDHPGPIAGVASASAARLSKAQVIRETTTWALRTAVAFNASPPNLTQPITRTIVKSCNWARTGEWMCTVEWIMGYQHLGCLQPVTITPQFGVKAYSYQVCIAA